MRKATTGFVLLGMLFIGGAVYFWGEGAFWPCEPAGRLLNGGSCTHLIRGDVGGAAKLPNGNLLVALGDVEGERGNAVRLVEVPATGGAPLNETVLGPNAEKTQPLDLAVSPDGQQIALLQRFDNTPRMTQLSVHDHEGKVIAEDLGGGTAYYMGFDESGRLLRSPSALLGDVFDTSTAEAFDLSVSQVPQPVNRDDLASILTKGITLAYNPDGTMFAQALDHLHDTPFVGLRFGTVGLEERPGMLLGASIRSGCNYSFSDLAFSPDGTRIAATFDCPDDWGQVSSTIEVWEPAEGEHVLTVPVINGFSEPFWYDDSTIIATRYNYAYGATDLFSIKVPEPRRY